MAPFSTCQAASGPLVPGLKLFLSAVFSLGSWKFSPLGTTIYFNTGAAYSHYLPASFFPSELWIPLGSAVSYLPLFSQCLTLSKILAKIFSESEWRTNKSTLEIFLILEDAMQRSLIILFMLVNNSRLPKLSFTNNEQFLVTDLRLQLTTYYGSFTEQTKGKLTLQPWVGTKTFLECRQAIMTLV